MTKIASVAARQLQHGEGEHRLAITPLDRLPIPDNVPMALATGADYIISTDLSCLMHLDGYIKHKGHSIRTMHIADVLANT